MKAAVTFEASTRDKHGKGSARAARREGKVPAIIYSEGKPGVSLALDANSLTNEYRRGGFFSKIIEIKSGKETLYALPKDIQFHPVSDVIEHVDFLRVTEKSAIKVRVPVHFLNQDRSIGLKRGGVLNIVRHDLELICGVNNIPKVIEIDLLKVNIGDSIHISHVALPEGVQPAITSRDFTIATIAGRGGDEEEGKSAEAGAVPASTAKADAKPAAKK